MSARDAFAPPSGYARPESGRSSSADGMVDIGALGRAIAARRLWIILPTVIVFVASFFIVNLITPRYTGEAQILLESRDGFFTRPAGDRESGSDRFDPEAVLSQVQVVMSRDLAREVIRRLNLVGNPEFDKGAGMFGSIAQLLIKVGVSRNPADRTPEDRVLGEYYDSLLVFPVARSRIIAIEFQSKDAELAAKAANTVAAVFLEFQEAAKKDTARDASTWLGGAIGPLRQRVQEAEARVEEFRARSGLLMGTNNTTITQQQLADLSQQLSSARASQSDAQAKARILREAIRAGRTFDVPDVANNELVRRLIEQRVSLRTQIALESRTLLPEHPRIKELTAQITDLESQIRSAAERTVRMLENEARIAGSRVETVAATIEAQKRTVGDANDSEVQLRALEREAKAQRDQLEQFMLRQREAIARDATNASPADARVISRAITPMIPSFPKKVPTVAVATLATLFIALAAVVSHELIAGQGMLALDRNDRQVPGHSPMEGRSVSDGAPTHGQRDDASEVMDGPRRARGASLVARGGRIAHLGLPLDDAGSWAVRIAACALPRQPGKGARLLAFDAGTQNAAKLLGAEMAEDASTLLIDLTAGTRSQQAGLSELLSGDATFADIIDRDPQSRLHVIPAGHAGQDAILAANELLELALDALSDAYDYVIIEVSSRDLARFQAALPPLVDGLLVIAGQPSNGHAAETAYRVCEGNDVPVTIVAFEEAGPTLTERRQMVEA